MRHAAVLSAVGAPGALVHAGPAFVLAGGAADRAARAAEERGRGRGAAAAGGWVCGAALVVDGPMFGREGPGGASEAAQTAASGWVVDDAGDSSDDAEGGGGGQAWSPWELEQRRRRSGLRRPRAAGGRVIALASPDDARAAVEAASAGSADAEAAASALARRASAAGAALLACSQPVPGRVVDALAAVGVVVLQGLCRSELEGVASLGGSRCAVHGDVWGALAAAEAGGGCRVAVSALPVSAARRTVRDGRPRGAPRVAGDAGSFRDAESLGASEGGRRLGEMAAVSASAGVGSGVALRASEAAGLSVARRGLGRGRGEAADAARGVGAGAATDDVIVVLLDRAGRAGRAEAEAGGGGEQGGADDGAADDGAAPPWVLLRLGTASAAGEAESSARRCLERTAAVLEASAAGRAAAGRCGGALEAAMAASLRAGADGLERSALAAGRGSLFVPRAMRSLAAETARLAALPAVHCGVRETEAYDAADRGDAGAMLGLLGAVEAAGTCPCWGEGGEPLDSAAHRRAGIDDAFALAEQLVRVSAVVRTDVW